MARKNQLRRQRTGTVINATSKQQEKEIVRALTKTATHLDGKFPNFTFEHNKQWGCQAIVHELVDTFPEVDFHCHFDNTSIKPDGGFLLLRSNVERSKHYPVLISEVKNQGTNDLRLKEGLKKQARGNAIERLGKNVIGLRTALLREEIFPFVCFGYGCDFEPDSSILDRVSTIAMFGELNKTYLFNEEHGKFNRGSFYFKQAKWTVEEMAEVMIDIAERSVLYYVAKYRESHFAL